MEVGDPNNPPLLFPVSLNLVKMMTLAMTNSFIGEMEDDEDPVIFPPIPSIDATDKTKKISEFAARIVRQSGGARLLWELDFDRNLYGASILRVKEDFIEDNPTKIRWQKVLVDAFYPVFDPADPDNLLEVWVANYLYPEQAMAKYGYDVVPSTGYVLRIEHWNLREYEITIDGRKVRGGPNPYGIVPFVYLPRIRTTTPYGDSLARDIYGPQDEVNMRLADASDALNYNMHPIKWGFNLPNAFNDKNYPIGADSMWDLGRQVNEKLKPEIGILETKNPVPEGLFKYVQFLYDWSRTASFAPPIAFGEDDGGGQRSGITLEIRLWPLLKAMRTARAFMASGVVRALKISGRILAQKNIDGIPAYISDAFRKGEVAPRFRRIMPRDQQAAVDEVVKLLSAKTGPAISLETAQEVLGRGQSELTKIMKFLDTQKDQELYPFAPERIDVSGGKSDGSPVKSEA
jgi:hypothetical protein